MYRYRVNFYDGAQLVHQVDISAMTAMSAIAEARKRWKQPSRATVQRII